MGFQPFQKFFSRSKRLYHELSTSEISGSFGDLGTLIPLLVTLSRQRTVLLAPALFFAGLSNLITGYTWDVPMCVQPMKSIAAVAIADQLSQNEVTTAGIWMGGFMLIIGISGLIEFVNQIITENVVSGIQIGVGIRLAGKGLKMVQNLGWLGKQKYGGSETTASTNSEMNADSILLAVICSLFVLYWLRVNNKNSEQIKDQKDTKNNDESRKRFCFKRLICCYKPNESKEFQHPVGLYLFFIGIIFATITLATTKNENNQYDLPLTFFGAPVAVWALETVTSNDWKVGLLEGAVPQLPLTTLNSVISVCALASTLYPSSELNCNNNFNNNDNNNNITLHNKGKHIPSRREVSISVGLINLLFCPFGSMPNCHGAGGLAAQHRLGARHGASVAFLGIGKMLLAIFLGGSALTLLDALPESILGVMLVIAGVELCVTGFVFLVNSSFKTTNEKQAIYEEEQTKKKENLTLHSTDEESDDINMNEEPNEISLNEEPKLPTVHLSSSPDWEKLKKEYLRRNTVVTVITASVIITLGKTHYGALSGWLTHLIYNDGWSDLFNSVQNCLKTSRKDQKEECVSTN